MSDREVIATIPLSKPLEKPSGEMLKTLELYQPKTGDIIKIGQPVSIEFSDGKVKGSADQSKLSQYLPSCTGLPQIILEGMSPSDAMLVLMEMETFFTQEALQVAERMFSQRSEQQQENSAS